MNDSVRDDLFRLARGIVRDDAEADDVVQEALLALHTATDVQRPDVWLRAVTRNRALDRLRSRRDLADVDELTLPTPSWESGGTEVVAAWLPVIVEALPEPYRTAVRRVDLQEVPQSVYAAEAGLSASGARTRVQRGRRLLLAELQACCPVRFEEGEVVDTGLAGCEVCR